MPNWCSNRVTISGDEKDVQALKKAVKGYSNKFNKLFSFDAIIPFPDELNGIGSPVTIKTQEEIDQYMIDRADSEWSMSNIPITQERSQELYDKYGADNWYDWCIENWTSKWDACDISLDDDESDHLTYRFETPWGPPESVYYTLKEQHPNVHITWFYDEPGMEFAGYLGDEK